MAKLSFKRHRFPPDIICYGVWLYFRFTLSFRDVEELLAQRGIDASYETVRCWTLKFGPQIARNLKRRRPSPSSRWHLDEMVVNIRGKRMYLWRAVDDEGEVLDMIVQHRRDTAAALKLLRRLIWSQKMTPAEVVTDGLKSYVSALTELGLEDRHGPADCARTTGQRTRICLFGDESERCWALNLHLQPNDFSRRTPPSTTLSTPNVTSSAAKLSAPSEPMRMRPGRPRLLFTEKLG
jgi:transposase-like protein